MPRIFKEHSRAFWTPARKRSLYVGIILIIASLFIQIVFGEYSYQHSIGAPWVSDLFLSILPVVNLTWVIVGCEIVLWFYAVGLLILRPRYLLFGTKAIALFIISRAFFFSLTHIGPYPTGISPSPHNDGYGLYHLITFQGNFFYSGHTGFPFLLALIFWNNKFLRRMFLVLTVLFGLSVLLAHVHYSIDVFAAPFIVYGMFVITKKFFPEDYALIPS